MGVYPGASRQVNFPLPGDRVSNRSWLTASASDRSGSVLVALLCCLGLEADTAVLRVVAVDRACDVEGD